MNANRTFQRSMTPRLKQPLLGECAVLVALLILLIIQPAVAQNSNAESRAQAANDRAALNTAKTGDMVSAEAFLFRSNQEVPNTIGWDIEAATRLTHLAISLREHLDYENGLAAAKRALAYLQEAAGKQVPSTPQRQRAQIYESAGFIQERVLFDAFSAHAAYLQAQQIDPSSEAAAAGIARVTEVENAETRVAGGKE